MKKLLFLLACVLMLASFASAAASYSDVSDKRLFYKFNIGSGTSVLAINQLGVNNATFDTAPRWLSAGGITGFNNYTNVTTSTMLNTTYTATLADLANFTVEFRIKANQTVGSQYIFSDIVATDATKRGFAIKLNNGVTPSPSLVASNGAALVVNDLNFGCPSLSDNNWHHFAIVKNYTNDWIAYYDGTKCTTARSGDMGAGAASLPFTIYNSVSGAQPFLGSLDQVLFWNRSLTAAEIVALNSSANDGLDDLVKTNTLNSPNGVVFNSPAITLNATFTATGSSATLINATYYIWNSTNSVANSTTIPLTGTSSTNTTSLNVRVIDSYKWNVYMCASGFTGGVAVTSCSFAPSNFTFSYGSTTNSNSYNTTTYETATESYITNVSIPTGEAISSANLVWNNTLYSASFSPSSGSSILTKTLDINTTSISNNVTWYWNLLYSSGSRQNLTTNYQMVNPVTFGLCNSSLNVVYLNYSFKNETIAQQSVSASISSSFSYWIGSGLYSKTYSFTNTTANPSYSFCFTPPSYPINLNQSSIYYNTESPQRSYNTNASIFTNATTNTVLYLLPSTAGIYVTFQVINPAQQAISGVTVSVVSPTFGQVESKLTDSSGGATFFLNPLTSYTITASKTGFTATSVTITPTQSQYTIQLGGTITSNVTDAFKGVTTNTAPIVTDLVNDTTYNFNFTISSDFWDLDSFGFTLNNVTDTLATVSSTTGTGGTVSASINTQTSQVINMNYFWVINGTYTNATRTWVVLDSGDTSWSILNLKSDLQTYLTSGMFGLTSFGLSILVFFVIFVITGVVSYKFSITSPTSVMVVVFFLVLIFDVGMGLIANPVNAIPNFPTFFVALILIGVFMREVTR